MLRLLKILAILGAIPAVLLVGFFFWGSAGSYPKDQYNEVVTYDLPTPDRPNSPADSFSVMSYNIGYLSGLANAAGTTSIEPTQALFEANLSQAIAALKAENADFIGLQEIDIASKRSFQVNQVKALAQALALRTAAIGITWDMNYVPFPFWPIKNHFARTVAGQAILSRYPIIKSERIVLEKVASQPFYYRAFYLDRVAQVAQIDVNGKPVVVINVHLEAFDEPTRLRHTQTVKALAEGYAAQYPVLLIGDFNSSLTRTSETNPTINLLLQSSTLKSAVPIEELTGKGRLTFPSNAPEDTLDYVFYNPDRIEVLSSQVVASAAQASDHLPLMVRFRLR